MTEIPQVPQELARLCVQPRVLVRRSGWVATAGLVLGAVAAALVAVWVGEHVGLGTYNHMLAFSPVGTFFRASLALGAKSSLAFWPLLTSAAILLAESGARRANQAATDFPAQESLGSGLVVGDLRRLGP